MMTELTAMDRCDACTAAALVRVVRHLDSDLIFCGHHYNKLQERLTSSGWRVTVDNRKTP